MWFKHIFQIFSIAIIVIAFSAKQYSARAESLSEIIADVSVAFNDFNDQNFTETYSLEEGEEIRFFVSDLSNQFGDESKFVMSLMRNYFPLSEFSNSINVLMISIAPNLLNDVANKIVEIPYVDPKFVDNTAKCIYALRNVTVNDKKGKFGYILIDSSQEQQTINSCIYSSAITLLGIKKPFIDFLNRRQIDYINNIGISFLYTSILFDAEKARKYLFKTRK